MAPGSSPWSGVFGAVLPDRVGKYTITRLIGAGGMGAVFEAVQDNPRRAVALKLLKAGLATEKSLRRFQIETDVLARLHHPCIAQIFEAGTHESSLGPVPYFAMELVGGPNVALTVGAMAGSDTAALGPVGRGAPNLTAHAQSRHLSVGQRLELMVHICDAVQHAHDKGVIHRDLKPDNILVDESAALSDTRAHGGVGGGGLTSTGGGAAGLPKIIDFGIARLVEPVGESQTGEEKLTSVQPIQTTHGHPIGTLAYMSPEQTLGDPNRLDKRSDIYALGVILYELLTGRLPYEVSGVGHDEAARRVRETRPIVPSRHEPTLKGDVENIILKALRRDRNERYQSAGEMRDDLQRVLAGKRATARRLRPLAIAKSDAKAWAGRHPWVATALVVVLAAVFAREVWRRPPTMWPDRLWQFGIFNMPMRAEQLSKVCMIAVDESMDDEAMAEALRDAGFEGLDPSDRRHLRAVYAHFLTNKLLESGTPAIGFDVSFNPFPAPEKLPPGEAGPNPRVTVAMADAVKVLLAHDPPIPVVVTYDDFPVDAAEPILTAKLLDAGVRSGGTICVCLRVGGWWLHVFQKPDGADPRPSLSLAIAMNAMHPGFEPKYRWDSAHAAVEVSFTDMRKPGAAADRSKTIYIGSDDQIRYEPMLDAPPDGEVGLVKNEMICARLLHIPTNECLNRSMLPLSKALHMPVAQLKAWIAGRAVIIANHRRKDVDDYWTYPDGRELSGSWAITEGAESLSGGLSMAVLRESFAWMIAGLAACVGAMIAWRVPALRRRVWVGAVGVISILAGCAAMFAVAWVAASPFPFVLALVLSVVSCSWIVNCYHARLV